MRQIKTTGVIAIFLVPVLGLYLDFGQVSGHASENLPERMVDDRTQMQEDSLIFAALNASEHWQLDLSDPCTEDWQQHWSLDGLEAEVLNGPSGMHFSAGKEFKNDAHHAVLWTKKSFAGQVKIEYEYTRTDSETRCVNILYIQATGHGKGPYVEDISKWSELRQIPAMRIYYENMNTLHISYAAFPNSSDTSSYIRARRYPAPARDFGKKTKIPPSYDDDGFFVPGETYHITALKTDRKLFFRMEGKNLSKLFSWDLSEIKPIREGRIGLRHMYTPSAIYKDFKVYTSKP